MKTEEGALLDDEAEAVAEAETASASLGAAVEEVTAGDEAEVEVEVEVVLLLDATATGMVERVVDEAAEVAVADDAAAASDEHLGQIVFVYSCVE